MTEYNNFVKFALCEFSNVAQKLGSICAKYNSGQGKNLIESLRKFFAILTRKKNVVASIFDQQGFNSPSMKLKYTRLVYDCIQTLSSQYL